MNTILLIDDDEDLRLFLTTLLLDVGYVVRHAPSPTDAFEMLHKEEVDLIISDLDMPFTSDDTSKEYESSFRVGVGTIKELSWVYPFKPIIAMSALPSLILEEIKRELGPVPLLPKPFRRDDLVNLVQRELTTRRHEVVQ